MSRLAEPRARPFAQTKGTYGYDSWVNLVSKSGVTKSDDKDPSAGLMDMMKQMYDDGDDNMKKMIGEAMLKSQKGGAEDRVAGDKNDFSLPDI